MMADALQISEAGKSQINHSGYNVMEIYYLKTKKAGEN
jgi:hypothetical protein